LTGFRPRKRFGQHFLIDQRVAERIAAVVQAGPDQAVLEVGPGTGALTTALVRLCGRAIGVEIDRDLVAGLRQRFPPQKLRLVEGDILRVDLAALLAEEQAARLVVVGNLPYNITAPLLIRLLEQRSCIDKAVLMVQREVAERLTAEPGSRRYGQITLQLALWAEVRLVMVVEPRAFRPVPKVHSAVIECRFSGQPRCALDDERTFRRLVRTAFGQRRKMLRNSLLAMLPAQDWARLPDIAAEAGIDLTRRPEQLALGEFCRLSDVWGRTVGAGAAGDGGRSA
jgi:16S rRNA (adenine1518-N6/adenine1519-N6)-dimethyltransferase